MKNMLSFRDKHWDKGKTVRLDQENECPCEEDRMVKTILGYAVDRKEPLKKDRMDPVKAQEVEGKEGQ